MGGLFRSGFKMWERVGAMGKRIKSAYHRIAMLASCAIPVIALTVGLTTYWPRNLSQNRPAQANQFAIKSNVNEVLLHMTVRDHAGDLVGHLNENNFQIYEEALSSRLNPSVTKTSLSPSVSLLTTVEA